MSELGNLNDPWITPEPGGQSSRVKAYCKIIVAGLDITNRLDPYLLSVEVHDGSADGKSLWAVIELDDREGQLPIPPYGSNVFIVLGWVGGESRMWNMTIDDIISSFQRNQGSGRHLTIQCSGVSGQFGPHKTPMSDHLGEGAPPGSEIGLPIPLGQWLSQVAGNAGGSAYIHPDLAGLTRDYWAMAGESPLHTYNKLAQEFGAVTRVEGGNQYIMTVPGENHDGSATTTVVAQWGVNLIAWRIHPWVVRTTWTSAEHEFFDTIPAQWQKNTNGFDLPAPFGSGNSKFRPPLPAPNSQAAYQRTDGVDQNQRYNAGDGLVTMNGEPAAQWNGHLQIVGARPGVDGLYTIAEAEHSYSRAGYITYLTLKVLAGDLPAGVKASLVSSGYPQPAQAQPSVLFDPTPEEYQNTISGVTYPPNPAPSSVQPAPSYTPATPSQSEPQGTVTIGPITPTGGVTD